MKPLIFHNKIMIETSNITSSVWQNELGCWCRKCPVCGKTITYHGKTNQYVVNKLDKNNSRCMDCFNISSRIQPKQKYEFFVRPELKVGEITSASVHNLTLKFQTVQYVCNGCGKAIIRKILFGEPFLCRCVHCGSYQSVAANAKPDVVI